VSTVLFFIVLFAVLAGLLVVAAVTAWLDDGAPARRRRLEHRVREAEREIDEIGRRTQEAILAEAWRRARNKRPGG
jgi:hypothetical protein